MSMPINCELTVTLQEDYNTYLFHALPLCVIKTSEKYDLWLAEHDVNIRMAHPQLIFFDYQDNVFWGIGNKIFLYEFLPRGIFFRDICSVLEERIEKQRQYAYIILDEFYLSGKAAYNERHFVHDSLLYGFNRDKKEFYAITDGAENGVLKKAVFTYEDITEAYAAICENIDFQEKSVIFFKLNDSYSHEFSLEDYVDKLIRYANGLPAYEYFYGKGSDSRPISFGIDVYRRLMGQFLEKESLDFFDFRCVHFLYEHKNILIKNLYYLINQKFLSQNFTAYVDEYASFKHKISIVRNQILKYLEMQRQDVSKEFLKRLKTKIYFSLLDYQKAEKNGVLKLIEALKRQVPPKSKLLFEDYIMNKIILPWYNGSGVTDYFDNAIIYNLLSKTACADAILMNNYIQVACKKNQYDLNYQNTTADPENRDLFTHYSVITPKEIYSSDEFFFMDSIRSSIRNGYYCHSIINPTSFPIERQYIYGDEQIVIYGYDWTEEKYFVKIYNDDYNMIDAIFNESQLKTGLKTTGLTDCKLKAFKLNYKYWEEVSIPKFYQQIADYVDSICSDSEQLYGQYAFYNTINMFESNITDQNQIHLRFLVVLSEHKKLMYKRIEYLAQNKYINDINLLNAYKDVVERAQKAYDVGVKYNHSLDVLLLIEIQEQMRELLEKEKNILHTIINNNEYVKIKG